MRSFFCAESCTSGPPLQNSPGRRLKTDHFLQGFVKFRAEYIKQTTALLYFFFIISCILDLSLEFWLPFENLPKWAQSGWKLVMTLDVKCKYIETHYGSHQQFTLKVEMWCRQVLSSCMTSKCSLKRDKLEKGGPNISPFIHLGTLHIFGFIVLFFMNWDTPWTTWKTASEGEEVDSPHLHKSLLN